MVTWDWSQNDITFDQVCWTFDGVNGCVVVPPPKPRENLNTGRGSGPTNGIRPWRREGPGYRGYHEDVQRESDIIRIKREDEEIAKLLHMLLSKGIM